MKVLKVAAIVIGAVALVATGVGALAGAGVFGASAAAAATAGAGIFGTLATVGTIATIASVALSVASQLATPKPSFSNQGNPLDFQTNPNSGLPYVIGRTRMSGLKIAGKTTATPGWADSHDLLFMAALLSCTPVHAIESYTADNVLVSFDGTTGAASGDYAGWMAQKTSLGPSPQTTALSLSLNGGSFPGWTSAHKLSGMAHALLACRYDQDGNHFTGGFPEPAWVILGRLCYDPRKDSTYPGGSGTHRWDDEDTWEWTRNPGLNALAWAIGRHANGKLVCGIGAPIETIRVWEFVECANVDDANRWAAGGVEWTTDSKWNTLKRILQAGGAVPTKSGAMIGCRVNTPRISVGTIESADFLDELVFPLTKPRRNRFNTALPRFPSEAHGWQVITGSEISVPAYVTADGGRKRTKGIDFPLVQAEVDQAGFDGNLQAGELAMYEIVNSREAGPIEFTTGPKWSGVHSGDCVVLNKPEDGISNIKVLVTGVTADPATGKFRFTAETESDGKHAFALGTSTTPPPAPSLTIPAGIPQTPNFTIWSVTPTALADGQAGLRVTGYIDDLIADRALIDYSPAGMGSWRGAQDLVGSGPLSADIGPIDSEADWDVRIAYSANGRIGPYLVIAGVTTDPSDITTNIANKASIYYQSTPPVSANENDIWYDSDDDDKAYRWNGTSWIAFSIPTATPGVVVALTRPSVTVYAYANGTVLSWAAAAGDLQVLDGGVDVTASATLIASPDAGMTGSIDAAGHYSVTSMAGDSGSLHLSATYLGTTYARDFFVSKILVGYQNVSSLPVTDLFEGRLAFLTTDGKLYRYHSGAWTAAVPAVDITGTLTDAQIAGLAASKVTGTLTDAQLAAISAAKITGQVVAAQIANAAITTAKFAVGIEPVSIVGSVPGSLSTRTVFNTGDGKLYRWNGANYVSTLAAADITGTLADAQLAALSASKITGLLSDSQLGAIAAAKVTGTLTDAQLAAISAAKITGQITSTQILDGSISTPKLAAGSVTAATIAADTITAAQIAAGAITATELGAGAVTAGKIAAGTIVAADIAAATITSTQLAAGSVTAGKIAAGTIQALDIAAGVITGDRLAANTITAANIAADTITAGQIAAGAINTAELAAGAVTAGKLLIADMENLAINGDFSSGLDYWNKRLVYSGGSSASIHTNASPGWPSTNALVFVRATAGDTAELSATNGSTEFGSDTALVGGFPVRPGEEFLFEAVCYATAAARPHVDLVVRDRAGGLSGWGISWIETVTTDANFVRVSGVLTNYSAYEGKAWLRIHSGGATAASNAALYYWNIRLKRRAAGSLIVDGSISALKIAANTITAAQIAAGTITAAEIAAGTITSTQLAAGSVTAGKIAAGTIQALDIATGAITAGKVAANAITATELATDAVTANKIAAGAITAGKVAAGAITAAEISAHTITADRFLTNAGVDLAAIVPGSLNTAVAGVQVGSVALNSGSSPVGPATTAALPCGPDDFIYLTFRFTITGASGFSGTVYFQRFVNGVFTGNVGAPSGINVTVNDVYRYTYEDLDHGAGNVSYAMVAVQTTGSATFSSSRIDFRRFAIK